MSINHHYDTVAFDKRDNATMLFFARTTPGGDIDDYLLLMRAEGEDFDEALYIEVNERQFAGHDLSAIVHTKQVGGKNCAHAQCVDRFDAICHQGGELAAIFTVLIDAGV